MENTIPFRSFITAPPFSFSSFREVTSVFLAQFRLVHGIIEQGFAGVMLAEPVVAEQDVPGLYRDEIPVLVIQPQYTCPEKENLLAEQRTESW